MLEDISVLVVDDSALMRNLVSKMINETAGLKTAGSAVNGQDALEKIPVLNPDVIVLDIEMPVMTGLEFLRERKVRGIKAPVVVLSSIAEKGAKVTMEALSLGASDFVQKPSGSISVDIATVKEQVTEKLIAYGNRYRRFYKKTEGVKPVSQAAASGIKDSRGLIHSASDIGKLFGAKEPAKKITPVRKTGKIELVCIGVSTGGPDALKMVFSTIDGDLAVPICVVQHMPAGFTFEFARSLDKICPLDVKEAEDGDELLPGRILIARGARHLEVEKNGFKGVARVTDSPPVSGHKPSADVLFASAACCYQNHVLGVIMTGMGSDGAMQLGVIYKEGGLTLGQDEHTAIVYGMPRVAYEMGHVMEQAPLEKIGQRISRIVKTGAL
ncbi:MAG: chemotaxis response regulator protein-glutamate methylesterase [Spirochaetaceae bacterium]|jgi:two-component system chemotaxis response regulator CheB|nr:chemotaxis response regulator protein-glutamate methylesterase [Spirochaetaceae bacterium]